MEHQQKEQLQVPWDYEVLDVETLNEIWEIYEAVALMPWQAR